jgi:hypothetical protein
MEKIKQFLESNMGKDIMVVLIVILVGLGSFQLGRLSKVEPKEGLKIDYKGQIINNEANTLSAIKDLQKETNSVNNFFASKKGKKYYSLGCSAGKTIKQENRIYFQTGEEAEKLGYTISSSCD